MDITSKSSKGSETAAEYRAFARLGAGGRDDRLGPRMVLRILLRCLPYVRPLIKPLVLLLVSAGILYVVGFFIGTNFWIILYTGVFEGKALSAVQAWIVRMPSEALAVDPLPDEIRRTLVRHLVVSGALAVLLIGPFVVGLAYLSMWILQQINQRLRVQMMDRLQSLSLRFHNEQRIGDSIYRMYQDSAMVTQLFDVLLIKPLQNLAAFVGSIAAIVLWDPRLAFLLILSWPLLLILGRLLSKPLRVGFRRAREANSRLTSRIQETIAGIKVLKAYNATGEEQTRFEHASINAFKEAYDARSRFALYKILVFYIVGGSFLLAAGWATWLTSQGSELFGKYLWITLGFAAAGAGVWNLGFYDTFKGRFGEGTSSERALMHLWGAVQDVAIGLDRVFELLDLKPEVEDEEDAEEMPPVKEGVRFRKVSFQYEEDRPAVKSIDLHSQSGTITAVVGPTGSGKSTLMALLLRLYDPDEGVIEIDDLDLRKFTVESVRDQISIALQENVLFGATVRENIGYALVDAKEEQILDASRIACVDEFVHQLPEGYDTLLGERGTKLSTGQRQRLSIARAIIKDTPILILDEPTAALDAETELKVLSNLIEWGRDRVIFLVTHRLSTIRRADQVAVIKEGELVELGHHDVLMKYPDGEYRRLIESEEAAARGTER